MREWHISLSTSHLLYLLIFSFLISSTALSQGFDNDTYPPSLKVHEENYPGGGVKVRFTYFLNEKQYQVLHGKFESYYTNGKPLRTLSFWKGFEQGKAKEFYSNGQLKWKGTYSKGKKVGQWKLFSDEGSMKLKVKFNRKGIVQWKIHYDIFGKKLSKEFFKKGSLIKTKRFGEQALLRK